MPRETIASVKTELASRLLSVQSDCVKQESILGALRDLLRRPGNGNIFNADIVTMVRELLNYKHNHECLVERTIQLQQEHIRSLFQVIRILGKDSRLEKQPTTLREMEEAGMRVDPKTLSFE